MPLNLPTSAAEVENRAKTDVQRELPGSNPFLKNSVLSAIVVGIANRIYDFYNQLRATIVQLFPDTAEDQFLERWAAIFGKQRLAATKSNGNAVATGTLGEPIPLGTILTSSDGVLYDVTATTVIIALTPVVVSITRASSIATVTTFSDHLLANNVPVAVALADQTEYNGIQTITVTSPTTFTYGVTGTPVTPATGPITASAEAANLPVESQDFQDSENDINVNLDSGSELTLQSPIVNVDDILTVDAGAIGGGTDQETDSQLRDRLLDRIQNPVAHFNVSDIVEKAKEIAGVTRVFVFEVTPALGQVTVYFMRDNDADPIPTASEVTTVKNKILEIKPANTADIDVIVKASTAVITNFDFASITPNTPTMQTAVSANLNQFFAEETSVGVDVDQDAYRAAIKNTVDPETGDIVQTFVLNTPIGDITINIGEIGVLGMVTYP